MITKAIHCTLNVKKIRIYFLRPMLDNGGVYAFLWEFFIAKGGMFEIRFNLKINLEICRVEQKSCLKDESCTIVFPSGQVFISLG